MKMFHVKQSAHAPDLFVGRKRNLGKEADRKKDKKKKKGLQTAAPFEKIVTFRR